MVPDAVVRAYRAGSFAPEVRAWHLEGLPTMEVVAQRTVRCPYCGGSFVRPETQIDHVIPMRTYVRWDLLNRREEISSAARPDMRALDLLDNAYGDYRNLVIACSSCNGRKSNAFLDSPYLTDRARQSSGALARRLEGCAATTTAIREHAQADFLVNGHPGSVRNPQTERQFIEFAVRSRLAGGPTSRPAWSEDLWARLASGQRSEPVRYVGSLCYYCLGVYRDTAFDLDHIHPSVGRRQGDRRVYNDAANLIPVCASCNRSKGSFALTTEFMDEQLRQRLESGLPGIVGDDDVAAAKAWRNRFLPPRRQRARRASVG